VSHIRTAVVFALAMSACSPAEEPQAQMPESQLGFQFVPAGTDVFLGTLAEDAGSISVTDLENATNRVGYDNQPHFTPDGAGVWYTAQDEQIGQTDIYRLDVAARTVDRVTATAPESEYSATPLPNGDGVSVIRVEADSLQRLWRIGSDGSEEPLLPELAPVGYHKWADGETLVMFVLGQPATLRIGNARTQEVRTVTENIGRSIHRIPGSPYISFVQRDADGATTIMRLDPTSGEVDEIAPAFADGDFHAWTPQGSLLMADGGRLMAWRPGATEWTEVADFTDQRVVFSRLAVSPTGSHIALVAEAAR